MPRDAGTRRAYRARRAVSTFSRRSLLVGAAAALIAPRYASAERPITFGLTPVFLDSDVQLLARLEEYLRRFFNRPVQLVKRRTYQEITALLVSNQLDAAWICGFPYVQFADQLSLVAVPLYRSEPFYQSYLIAHRDHPATRDEDLRGSIHAFSDPDSNSGFLVTRHWLAVQGESPQTFFRKSFFTYGHRNVVRAVSSGLAHSGSVDGYIWDVLAEIEPRLVADTRVVHRSEKLGFPPIACARSAAQSPITQNLQRALIAMPNDPLGRSVLSELRLDGFVQPNPAWFAGIADKYRFVRSVT